jgi:hypothetical protein
MAQQIHHVRCGEARARGHVLGGFEREAAGEDGETAEQRALEPGEQVVTPVDAGAQRSLAWQRGAVAARQQAETIGKVRGDLLDGQRADARRGELDRQRNAVEVAADVGDCGGIGLGHPKRGLGRDGAVGEQAHRFEPGERRQRNRSGGRGIRAPVSGRPFHRPCAMARLVASSRSGGRIAALRASSARPGSRARNCPE